jgi:geranylgeranyl diphosphate synthase, type II
MHSFQELSEKFRAKFEVNHFPSDPSTLYEPASYFLTIGGKRIRPVMCLMANELFDEIRPDTYQLAIAIELFHNFTLIHDDIMDKAPLRRGMQTVHEKYSEATALLAGDVMLVAAYEYISRVKSDQLNRIFQLFNKTSRQVCEGQQLDMDYEKEAQVSLEDYIRMIELKTSVLLAGSLQLGAIMGGAGKGNQEHIYEFGRNLGIAFQIQDDFLDAFGDPQKFGKQVGGDIMSNKKTFLMIKAMEVANEEQAAELKKLAAGNDADKVGRVLAIFRTCGVDVWAMQQKEERLNFAFRHLSDIAVSSARKEPLKQLAQSLMQREY